MDDYICKIATLDEVIEKCDYENKRHPNNNIWVVFKENAIKGFYNQSKIMYIGKLNNEIICEATAIVDELGFEGDITNFKDLLSDERAYLSGFRTNKEYEGKGYFSKLFQYMIRDLKAKGYTEVCLGVEPCEVRNMQIYFKYGFTNYLKTSIEYLPKEDEYSLPKEEIINYYYKKI